MPGNIEDTLKHYRELIPQLDDFVLNEYPDKLHFWIEDFNSEIRDRVKPKIELSETDPSGSNAYSLMIEEAKKSVHHLLEPRWNIYDRAQSVKKFTKQYIAKNPMEK